jgi:hypothetical protein
LNPLTLRTTDVTSKITIPKDLSKTTLHAFKDYINTSPLGPIQRHEQRLFHLGKEIKSGNRSLEALGIGRFNVFSVHLHSLKVKVTELLDESEEEVEIVDAPSSTGRRRREKVVELLDSDSDDDDDIEVVEVTGNKRRRKNEITID